MITKDKSCKPTIVESQLSLKALRRAFLKVPEGFYTIASHHRHLDSCLPALEENCSDMKSNLFHLPIYTYDTVFIATWYVANYYNYFTCLLRLDSLT